jgi:putative transposase
MPRTKRISIGNYVYHVLNHSNARAQIFDNDEDYRAFEKILEEGVKRFDMRLLAYCLMPNHWHLVLFPKKDGDLSHFMAWLTNTHTRRWHMVKGTVSQGHLYQGRYKSFLCQNNNHCLALIRYVERNAKRANMVQWAEDWRWSSAWRREKGTEQQKKILSLWPIEIPKNYLSILNEPQSAQEELTIRHSVIRSSPYGQNEWVQIIAKRFNLESTLRPKGRPLKR